MNTDKLRRFVLPIDHNQHLPIAVESIGLNPDQEKLIRDDGYPYYHILQTLSGEGSVTFDDKTHNLPTGSVLLLFPGIPHSYESSNLTERWETAYLTFGGPLVEHMLISLGIHGSSLYRLSAETSINHAIENIVEFLEQNGDVFGIETSTETYRFLVKLAQLGTYDGRNSRNSERLKKLRKVADWMALHYMNPDIGMKEITAVLGLSSRRLTDLFQESFGLSPYAYFIQLRIRKAKEQLVRSSSTTVRDIAQNVGFRDASHFVSTFRKYTGMTPERFRNIH